MFDFHHIFIGSYALNIYPYNDIDVVCYEKDLPAGVSSNDGYIAITKINGVKYEFMLADRANYLQLLLEMYSTGESVGWTHLLVLKAGHLHISSKKWQKHMNDYILLRMLTRNPPVPKYLKLHVADTNRRVKPHKLRLKNVSKSEFFDDAVKKYHDHDYLHEQLAIGAVPAYTLMQKDESVMCHKDLWKNLTEQQKLNCATEESMVIGMERFIIPALENNTRVMPSHMAFRKGVEKLCTTLSGGWFRAFCHENYKNIVNNYKDNLMEQFKNKHYK